MPYTCAVEGRIVCVSWHGLLAQEDLDALGQDMPRIGRGLGFAPDVLHTFKAVTGLGFEPTAAYQYSLKQKAVRIPNPIRAAMVATTKENEYLATVFVKLNRATNLEMKVFFDEPSARCWLARQ